MANTYTRANIVTAGVSTWKIRESGKTEFVNLPYLKDAKVTEKTLFTKDKTGREWPYAVDLEVSAKMFAVNDLTGAIELFDNLGTLDYDHQVTALNGTTWDTSKLTPTLGGLKWTLVSDSDMDDVMYLELMGDRRYLITQIDTIHDTPTTSTADTGTVDALADLTAADIGPAGIYKIEYGAGSYSDDIQAIRNGKLRCELLTTKDSLGRSKGYAIKIDLEAEAFQASSTEALLLNTLAGQDNDWQVTMNNGRVLTMDSQLGVHWELTHSADSDDTSFIKIKASGVVLPAAWDGIWT